MNFMYQLKLDKMIDYNVVMVNQINTVGNASIAKFGGWDPEALAHGEELHIFRCTDQMTWAVNANQVIFNGAKVETGL